MIVRPDAVRRLLRARGAGGQVSQSAIVALCTAIERAAEVFAEESVRAFRAHNEARAFQHLEPLSRLTDEHVATAVRRSHGNP